MDLDALVALLETDELLRRQGTRPSADVLQEVQGTAWP